MSPRVLAFFESSARWMIAWFALFTCVNAVRIARRLGSEAPPARDNAGLTELAGLPLTFLQPVLFVLAAAAKDAPGMLLFLWWGPGFVATLVILLVARLRGWRIDWSRLARPISWACKLWYVAYAAVFWHYREPLLAFAFSVWIMNDQIEKLFMSLDADRTRRTFDDKWIVRVLYPAGLLLPLFAPTMPWRPWLAAYGVALLLAWIAGLAHVYRKGKFFELPEDPSLLRNMVYFGRLRV